MQRFFGVAQDINGNAIPSTAVRVNLTGVATLATLFSDNVYTPLANPFTSNTDGTYQFYARDGRYDIILTKTGFTFQNAETADTLLDDNESVISPAQITANQNDYSPTNALNATVWRINSDATRFITGIAAGFTQQYLTLVNIGSFVIPLVNNSGSSAAGNKIATASGQDYVLFPNESVLLTYDLTSAVWRIGNFQSDRVIDRVGTGAVLTGNAENTIYTFSVPGGLLGTGRRFRLTLNAIYTNTTGLNDTMIVRFYYGGTNLGAGLNAQAVMGNGVTNGPVRFVADVVGAGATNAQDGVVVITTMLAAGNAPTASDRGTAAIDSTTNQTFSISTDMVTGAANMSIQRTSAIVEWLP